MRRARAQAVQQRGALAARLADARRELQEADRSGVPRDAREKLRSAYENAVEALRIAQGEELQLRHGISKWVSSVQSPVERIGELDASVPVALFPVRIETRFHRAQDGDVNDAAGELLVRIYPDGILAQTHEPLLTEVEAEAGRDFWRRIFQGMSEQESWAALRTEAEATRGAWIVEVTTPENLDERPSDGSAGTEPQFPAI